MKNDKNYLMIDGKKIILSNESINAIKEELQTSNPLPTTWEELEAISGYYITNGSSIMNHKKRGIKKSDKNVIPSKEEAEAFLALAQLLQLRDRYNGDWKPDWNNINENKYCIIIYRNLIEETNKFITSYTLHFKTEALRDYFLENFRDLIIKAKPLL